MVIRLRSKRGRPPLPPGEKKLDAMGFRPTPEVREKLEAAAKENGRSLSREVESRLEQSFLNEEAKYETFGGKHTYGLMRLLGSAVSLVETTNRLSIWWILTPLLITCSYNCIPETMIGPSTTGLPVARKWRVRNGLFTFGTLKVHLAGA